ncbi:phosphotransferase [Paenibacillus sp. NPDC058071]|uniref:phosphotransferase n=1 Tax=Paenibacillus sp. NPDC058071 TaxID=3346326 RepID=UPI0036DA3334
MTRLRMSVYLEQYRLGSDWTTEPGPSGMNNTTTLIRSGNKRYVLREYNNHKDSKKAEFEHAVLKALHTDERLTLLTPVPLPNEQRNTVTLASDGTLAALFEFIPGERPDVSRPEIVRSLGAAAAEISLALERLKALPEPIYEPYWMLEDSYAAINDAAVAELTSSYEELTKRSEKLAAITRCRKRLGERLEAIKSLPRQWIHGDVNASNSLSVRDDVTAILDFEFVTMDAGAMEPAVAIADLLSRQNANCKERIALFCEGFGSVRKLSVIEAELMPDLVRLRLIDVALHFAVRLLERLDSPTVLAGIVDNVEAACRWTEEHESWLSELAVQHLASGEDRGLKL